VVLEKQVDFTWSAVDSVLAATAYPSNYVFAPHVGQESARRADGLGFDLMPCWAATMRLTLGLEC
jgi:hypothetical protein